MDTGIYEHPDLNMVASQNFISGESSFFVDDITGHGTHCAGIAGGNGTSSSGRYRGVATGVSLINAKAGSYAGLEDGDIISAINWAVITQNADIVSMSFGGGGPDPNEPLTQTITNTAKNYGAILVSSAGNSGPDYFTGGAPAAGKYIISVGATDSTNNLSSFSSWGPTYSYIGYPDALFHVFEHVVDGQGRNGYSGHCFHFNACFSFGCCGGFNADAWKGAVRYQVNSQ